MTSATVNQAQKPDPAGGRIAQGCHRRADGDLHDRRYRGQADLSRLSDRGSGRPHHLRGGGLPALGRRPAESDAARRIHKTSWRQVARLPPVVVEHLRMMPADAHPLAALRSGVSLLAHYDPQSESMDPKATRAKAERLLGQVPTIVAARARLREGNEPIAPRADLPAASNFLWMLFGKEPDAAHRARHGRGVHAARRARVQRVELCRARGRGHVRRPAQLDGRGPRRAQGPAPRRRQRRRDRDDRRGRHARQGRSLGARPLAALPGGQSRRARQARAALPGHGSRRLQDVGSARAHPQEAGRRSRQPARRRLDRRNPGDGQARSRPKAWA